MPLYDFHCLDCDCRFESLVRGADVPKCPQCASAAVRKLISLPAAKGKSKDIVARARRQAAREGHFSNYAPSERPRRK